MTKRFLSMLLVMCMMLSFGVVAQTETESINISLTVRENAEVKLYTQEKYFVLSELNEVSNEASEEGLKVCTFSLPTDVRNVSYRVTEEGYVTKAGYIPSPADGLSLNVISESTDIKTKNNENLGTAVINRDEADIYIGSSADGVIYNATESKIVRAYRMWEIINNDVGNVMIEPDFYNNVIFGEAEITAENWNNAGGNKLSVITDGEAVIAVGYNAIDIDSGSDTHSHDGVFPAVDPQRTAVFVATSEPAGTAVTDIKPSAERSWDYNFDTWYFTEEDNKLEFGVISEGETTVEYGFAETSDEFETTFDGWEVLTVQEDGYSIPLENGGTVIIKITDDSGVSYKLVRVAEIGMTTEGIAEDGSVAAGDTISITIEGLYRCMYKMSGIFNPSSSGIIYTDGETEIKQNVSGYNVMDSITAEFTVPEYAVCGTRYELSGNLNLNNMYAGANPFEVLYSMTDEGKDTNLSAVQVQGKFGRIPPVSFGIPGKNIMVAAYDHNAVAAGIDGASDDGVIMEQQVTVAENATTKEVIAQAFDLAGVEISGVDTGYVTEINGLGEGEGYSGWMMAYNNGEGWDDYSNYGMDYITLKPGDKIRFDYTVNNDMNTDDIGNGFYGLPIFTELDIDGEKVYMKKQVSYDANYMCNAEYFVKYQDEEFAKTTANGTEDNPFEIDVTLPSGSDTDDIEVSFKTTLGNRYRLINGEIVTGYTFTVSDGDTVVLSSLGGRNKAYYEFSIGTKSSGEASTGGNKVKVTFSLIGSEQADEDVELNLGESGYNGAKYIYWVKKGTHSVNKGTTASELITQVTKEKGLKVTGLENGYISAIKAPKNFGGYTLSEMDNGEYSGWMYTVNGKHVAYGINDYILKNGDNVVLHYVNDYRYEVSDLSGMESLGDGSLYNKWLDGEIIRDSGRKSSSVKVPVVQENPVEKPEEKPEEKPDEGEENKTVKKIYTDVKNSDWYAEAVSYVSEKEIMQGISESEFSPEETMTRAMLATVVYRLAGQPQIEQKTGFEDIAEGQWYSDAVAWANQKEVMLGTDEGIFSPEESITRQQLVCVLYRFSGEKVTAEGLEKYSDAQEIDDYAKEAFCWAVGKGIVCGVDENTIDPHGNATRGQIALILMRYEGITK